MKILYDDNVFSWQKFGGISRYFVELMLHSKNFFDWKLSAKFSNNEYLNERPEFSNIRKSPLDSLFFENWKFRGKGMLKKAINQICDIGPLYPDRENKNYSKELIVKGEYNVFHPTYYDDYFIDIIPNKPFVLTVHDMIHEIFAEYFPKDRETVGRKANLIKHASHIIAISESTKRDIIKYFDIPESNISVIYHGASFGLGGPEKDFCDPILLQKLKLPRKYILFTGSRTGYKNFDYFILSITEIMLANNDLYLVCTGRPFTSDEKKFLNKQGFSMRVRIYSASDAELFVIYSHALCFIFPSLYEGFGLPILEAFSAGCPVILNNASSLPEIGGDAALYFDIKQPESLSMQLKRMLNNSDLRSELTSKGHSRLKQFSWEKTTSLTAEVYRKVAQQ